MPAADTTKGWKAYVNLKLKSQAAMIADGIGHALAEQQVKHGQELARLLLRVVALESRDREPEQTPINGKAIPFARGRRAA